MSMSHLERLLFRLPPGTPQSNAHHSSRVQQSIEHEAIRRNLQRRRKKSADDMADKSVGEDVVWFADYHFPPPPPSSISSSRKTIKKNPFKTLKGANLLGERDLTRRFVSPPLLLHTSRMPLTM
ncbi:hypothetical protein K466DRAFT_607863 [Polyporus arcularius HHB13444]|uniref:Uncharacterized protein n=1 Tax=Polyporus arcularius HHB13444 TaxID=1314778 RepID=A0A5C3NLT6_9APHY|nr:hypothetical protein K466DRAFT_607863 [Polyporus arcularius HHB13444]